MSMMQGAGGGSAAAARRRRAIVWGGRLVVPLVVAAVWQLAVQFDWLNPFFTSTPAKVIRFLADALPGADIWKNLWVTLQETLWGFGIGAAGGVLVGLLFARYDVFYEIFRPYLTALNSLPRIALAPLFVLWFGLGSSSKVALVISLVFFIVLSATMGSIGNVDPDLMRMGRVLGFGPRRVFTKVMLPWAVPGVFAGLELALVYAFLGAVAGEMLAAKEGIGQQLQFYAGTFNTAAVLGTLAVLAFVATILSMLMDRLKRRLMRHQQ